ncbi:MBOAT family O-acyltransferase [uncultured Tyzzerella sp.]|uniref:MBOAT family O-acyltransferase n=1 Tax=uncultured Tyzzerella sp. TaxID=2321398 RepID=UPI00294336DA|nr:MBOAT family O-acyltransferase [uncultured Tyzzerella sp.]
MLFNSLTFLIFLVCTLGLYYTLPHKYRWYLLLVGSCIFYMAWRIEFIFLILFSSFFNYYIGILIEKYNSKGKFILTFGLIINFIILFIFKYSIFINHSFMALYNYFNIPYPIKDFDIILPMGISFYTFQATSYTIDIYRKRYKAEKNILKVSLYIMFFPQLVAGPIERADRLLNQLFLKHNFNINNISTGIKIMLIGYFKKIVIADRVAILVNTVYNSPYDYSGISFIIATIFFAIQLYCDFSGYSDIAIGCAKLFGINLMENFKSPYFSKTVKEFWTRWHISLSTWFKDYLYIPLGGNRKGTIRTYFNLMITFLVSGIWHGANWTFILWGGLNGFYQIIGDLKHKFFKYIGFNIKNKYINNFFNVFKILITFSLICFSLIFFRANTVKDAFYIVNNLFSDIANISNIQYLYNISTELGLNIFEILASTGCIILLFIIELFEYKQRIYITLNKLPFIIRFIFYYLITIIIISMGVFSNAGQFIYFQF